MIVSFLKPVCNLQRFWGGRCGRLLSFVRRTPPLERPPLDHLAADPERLPPFVRQSAVAMRYLRLLGDLPWSQFPERDESKPWPGPKPAPRAPFVAAYLVKITESRRYFSDLRKYLTDHPALVWVLGFPLTPDRTSPNGFDVHASVPCRRQLARVLREMDNDKLQFLLDGTVAALEAAVPEARIGDRISLDTKHIIAWVRENNPGDYVRDRFDPERQPKGDPDCRLGVKRTRNTPTTDGLPASQAKGEYYWGYASGVVASRLPGRVEFVLAELTRTFDRADITYFHPLMGDTERRLGRRPRFGALDAAYDASYIYDYFHEAGGFAAVPLVARGGVSQRSFDDEGRPLCSAGLGMPLVGSSWDREGHVAQERGRFGCPLIGQADACPVNHEKWPNGGCQTTLGLSDGARVRYTLDRKGDEYKTLYNERTACERINSQAKELGIERPRLRNRDSIANYSTLIYVLVNLRALGRVRQRRVEHLAA